MKYGSPEAARAAGLGPRARDAGEVTGDDAATWGGPILLAGLVFLAWWAGKDAERAAERRRAVSRGWAAAERRAILRGEVPQ